ncbi:PocR ligand-binding domain-containing protein [Tissierella sp.]|uniref:PocR ligand-binding domain-containing protein n=1 Tax=Tissierella sp. TaxID=41274 RepID=UPI0028A63ACF|nr:PocR ligand-binding domain-containing protein [Tissierella sp.]
MDIKLTDILTEDFLEKFQDSFAFATGFGVVFVDLDGNHIGEGSNFSKFCSAINKTKEGASYCALTNRKAIDLAIKTKKPSIYICHAGLINIEIPLTYGGEYIGAITAGQVLCSDMDIYPKDSDFKLLPWLHTEEAAEYFRNIKVLTRQEIEATAVSLENIANYIIQNTMYNKLQEKLAKERQKTLEYEKKQIEMEHQLKLAELEALQKQVTPHFIFNVVSSISRLISMEEYTSASNMLDSFSQMLRYSLSDISSQITLEQELNYIQNYLVIQKNRFCERIEYEIITDSEILSLIIPYFSLQPLVENAIEHGLLPLEKGGKLKLNFSTTPSHYCIEIFDNGIGMNDKKLNEVKKILQSGKDTTSTNHIGLKNCYRRFKLMYGENSTFNIESRPNKGTRIYITISRNNYIGK